jgi:hypothetical protein
MNVNLALFGLMSELDAAGFFGAPFGLWAALSRLSLFVRLRWRFEKTARQFIPAPRGLNLGTGTGSRPRQRPDVASL